MADDDLANDSLQPLLDRLAAGDESAGDLLIEHSIKRMQRLAHFMLGKYPGLRRWYETADVSQAAVLRLRTALQNGVKPVSPRDFINFAATQIRRELCDLTRHEYGPEGPGRHHESKEPPGYGNKAAGPGPATQARWHDFLQHIQETLSEEEREVFDLLVIQELSQQEAAQLLGVSVPTVKRRWRSARERLHDAIHVNWSEDN
jgi:RNA polymerase sigma factor (sigma-70 family)